MGNEFQMSSPTLAYRISLCGVRQSLYIIFFLCCLI